MQFPTPLPPLYPCTLVLKVEKEACQDWKGTALFSDSFPVWMVQETRLLHGTWYIPGTQHKTELYFPVARHPSADVNTC